jgi:acyl transferase domain-containing protein
VKGKSIGVYVGGRTQHAPDEGGLSRAPNPILAVGPNYLAANVSRYFDLRGPSLMVDSACSSALVAMSLAVQSLQSGEVSAAIVGGVNVLSNDRALRLFAQRGILSPEPVFHMFDRRAQGVVLGEGVGLVLLKTMAQAQADGDRIYAVLKGLSVNNDGRTAGPAAPNVQAQKDVMQSALLKSRLDASRVAYIDANGSGSQVNDLLELKAIQAVYRQDSALPLGLGSMKPNIGHPLCAEGIASFIKVVLMLHHRRQVPFLSAHEPMPHYDLAASPFMLHRQSTPWNDDLPVAAINSFADGGTNAHAVLQAWAESASYQPARGPLSAPVLNRVDVRGGDRKGLWGIKAGKVMMSMGMPMIRDHEVHGANLLPGLAYIDLIYQWFSEQGYRLDQLAIRNLSILRPLTMAQAAEVEVLIQQEPMGPEAWRVAILGVTTHDMPEVRYMTAEVHTSPRPDFDETLSERELASSSVGQIPLEAIYADARDRALVHARTMRGYGLVYLGADACVVRCRLSEPSTSTGLEPLMSPALLDACAVALGRVMGLTDSVLDEGFGQKLLLPLFYESFHASESLKDACLARVARASVRERGELHSMTLEFFTEAGRKVAELKGFTSKLVREAGLNPVRPATPVAATATPESSAAVAIDVVADARGGALELVRGLFAKRVGKHKAQLDTGASYYELGLTSTALLELVTDLSDALGESLTPTLLFECTSMNELADHLAQHFGDKCAQQGSSMQEKKTENPQPSMKPEASSRASRLPSTMTGTAHDIAIVGLSGRYPGSRNLGDFWRNLSGGVDCVVEVPESRWGLDGFFDEDKDQPGRSYCKWGGFIDGVDEFDALYFNISPREAQVMDPQARLFLESVAEVLEDGGYTRRRLREAGVSVGVYVGAMYNQYRGEGSGVEQESILALSSYSAMANRVSYYFGFDGPSMAIDTMCSSSTVAIHQACKDLISGECHMAVAGGVNLSIDPRKYVGLSQIQLLGSSANSRSFSGSDGYLPSEGVGTVLLKRLDDALADGDRILAVIKASASNHSGHSSGYSVPSPNAQAKVMETCLARAGVDKTTITYVEASANGSSLGDAVELSALRKVFGTSPDSAHSCVLGSVKSNIGHPEAVSGMAQLSKVVLQLTHGQIVPSIHVDQLSPTVQLEGATFAFSQALMPWTRAIQPNGDPLPRRALINSFAAGGTYASLVVEEYIPASDVAARTDLDVAPQLMVLSAKSEERLKVKAEQLMAHLIEHEQADLEALAYTLQIGRESMACRLAWVARDRQALLSGLKTYVSGGQSADPSVPALHVGNMDDVQDASRTLLDGAAGLQFVQGCLARGELDRLAQYWSGGGKVAWDKLHPGRLLTCVPLPTYPFERRRHWAGERPGTAPSAEPSRVADKGVGILTEATVPGRMAAYMRRSLAQSLGLDELSLKDSRPLRDYGLDSVQGLRLMRQLSEAFGVEVSGRELLEHNSIGALSAHLAGKRGATAKAIESTEPTKLDKVSPSAGKDAQLALLRTFRTGLIEIDEVESMFREEQKNETA